MLWPLDTEIRMMPDEPGQFGTVRKHDVHTGVDLYCDLGTRVVAMEPGRVVGIEPFTGAHVPGEASSPWWNDTWVVLVSGRSSGRVIAYGEVGTVEVLVGDELEAGQQIGVVSTSVLRRFKGRPKVMLHVEVYECLPDGYTGAVVAAEDVSATVWWKFDEARPARLSDPTPLLSPLANAVFNLGTYFQAQDGK
jgi:murein DD-endopeptidase MepM/ murein hydrolase activator NlpD